MKRTWSIVCAVLTAACGDAGSDDATKSEASCGINTAYAGDDACLVPPPPDEGMQIHVGPKDYQDAADVDTFLLEPGGESSECWTVHTPNDVDVYFQTYELRGRPGTHHIINTMYRTELADGGFGPCQDPGTGTNPDILANLPSASRAHMPRLAVAPENQGIAQLVPARAPIQADMHYFNTGSEPILREFWLNLYFVPAAQVTDSPDLIRGMGGLSWNATPIAPGTRQVYSYACPIESDGRILSLFGHTHAHGLRETAFIRRASGDRQKVFEQYDYQEPQMFQYDSIATNPSFSTSSPGAHSGPLEVFAGDALEWECEVDNNTDRGLTYTNDVFYGEMCNIWGQSVGVVIDCIMP